MSSVFTVVVDRVPCDPRPMMRAVKAAEARNAEPGCLRARELQAMCTYEYMVRKALGEMDDEV